MFNDFLKDIIRYIPSKILPGLFGFLVIPVFTRLFSPNEYGKYVIVMSTVSMLSIIAQDWMTLSVLRFYPEYQIKSETGVFYGTILRIMVHAICIVSIVSFISLYLLKSYFTHEMYTLLNIGLLILVIGIAFDIMLNIHIAQRNIFWYSLFTIWRQCICVVIGILFVVFFKLSIVGLFLGIAAGIIFIIPLIFRLTFKDVSHNVFSNKLRTNIFLYGFPLVVSNLSGWILSLSDRYIIEYFRGSFEVGLYSISYSLTDRSITIVSSLIILASNPIIMNKWESGSIEETKTFIRDMAKFYIIILFPAVVGISMLSENIVKILATKEYYDGYKIIPMVAASVFIFGLQRNFQIILLFFKKTKLILFLVLIAGLINIGSNLILVPRYGFIAAAYTTLLSYSILAFLIIIVSRRYLKWDFPFITFGKVVLSCVVMSIVIYGQNLFQVNSSYRSVIFGILLGGLSYILMLIFLKEVDRNSIRRILESA